MPVRRGRRLRLRSRGSVTLWFLLTFTALLIIGAFAIDLPRVFAVSGELQNGADAAALAGAGALSRGSTSGPNWTAAAASATTAIALNKSDGVTLSSGTVKAGYWDVAASSPTLLAPSQVTLPAPSGQMFEPAVQVTIARNASSNGGLVSLLLGSLLGVPTTADSATAVAVIAPPSAVPAGSLFPMVMDQCVYNQYWDSTQNAPKVDASGQPYEFQVGNGQTYGGTCEAGQWTSFNVIANNTPTIINLITSGNPTPLSVGDSIYILPGVKDAIYSNVPTGTTVLMPVGTQIDSKTSVPIVAFAAFYIDSSVGQDSKYIQGHFVAGYTMPTQGTGVSTWNYGGYVAPRLAF
ncbi:TadG family pilus assembly protein [Paraburkholderia tagetis]|uniref:TadG family pilus assembly protein n=1 Tax=Paraburkholderia tagetis TaxID=2913261 RepID=UPI0023674EF4|nr:TadG family pilus assembly protein [Paraburkholderia tagetis]